MPRLNTFHELIDFKLSVIQIYPFSPDIMLQNQGLSLLVNEESRQINFSSLLTYGCIYSLYSLHNSSSVLNLLFLFCNDIAMAKTNNLKLKL